MRAFKGKAVSESVGTNILLEDNKDFIPTFNANGYDLIRPIAFNEFNWLEKNGIAFVDSILNLYLNQYSSVFISGFSDGGTGAYRLFYGGKSEYTGAIIFNGYPQLSNFHRSVKYENHSKKKVVFYSQKSDKVVPSEFLLTEYRRQKIMNAETYFFLNEGKHEFIKYSRQDFENLIALLGQPSVNYTAQSDSIWIYPPVDGLLISDSVKQLYHFRRKICKGYGMQAEEYEATTLPELTNENKKIFPCKISKSELQLEYFLFPAEFIGRRAIIRIKNYLAQQAW